MSILFLGWQVVGKSATRRPLAERRKMRDRRAAERTPARAYVAKLLGNTATTQPADLKKLIREDASIAPLRKLVAMEQLDIELRNRQREAERKAASTQPGTKPESPMWMTELCAHVSVEQE